MTLEEMLRASQERQEGLREWATSDPLPRVRTPANDLSGNNTEQGREPDLMALLGAVMAPNGRSGGGGVSPLGSTYVGGSGDFNATHEGPGLAGLTRGEPWEHYDIVKRLANRIENKFGINVGSGIVNRNVAGSSTPSEHAYGAAIDIMAAGKALQDRINQWLLNQRRAEKFGYSNILGYWNRPSDHSNHIHVGWLS